MLLRKFVYVQVYRGRYSARIVGEPTQVSHQCSDLSHPRSLFNKFEPVRASFESAFRELKAFRFGLMKPTGLIHLVEKVEGGYTHAELRAFREAAQAAGMHNTLVLDDKYGPVSDQQLLNEIIPHLSPF